MTNVDRNMMVQLESNNWNENDSQFHVFNTDEELLCYLRRSKNGRWWREEYGIYDFEQCVFNFNVTHWRVIRFESPVHFRNAKFIHSVSFKNVIFEQNADFAGCSFEQSVDFSGSVFFDEFISSSFNNNVKFTNTKFKKFIDFDNVAFRGIANFINSQFENGVSFNDAVFFEEFNFYNSIILDNISFEGTEFKKKVNSWEVVCKKDISFKWANFRNKLNMSNLDVNFLNFHGTNFEDNAYLYNSKIYEIDITNSVISKGIFFLGSDILLANRESWRLIKHEFIKQNNKIEVLKYHSREMGEYQKEIFGNTKSLQFSIFRLIRDICLVFKKGNRTDKFIVLSNRISNGFNTLPFRGVFFTSICTLLFYLIFIYIVKLENKNIIYEYSFKHIGINIKNIIQFINITDWKYKPFNLDYNYAYLILFLGRIIISFGIYQTVQAFRKFGNT